MDKPGKSRDFYHTCYALSGLSVAQHQPDDDGDHAGPILVGGEVNLLVSTEEVGYSDPLGNYPISVTVSKWLLLCHCNQLNFTITLINWDLRNVSLLPDGPLLCHCYRCH